jgi:tRNA(fMet)-specific endonuclease VapC
LTRVDADIAAGLRVDLSRKGQLIGEYDLLIAAQALRLGFTVVTNNSRHFSRIPSLQIIDWS